MRLRCEAREPQGRGARENPARERARRARPRQAPRGVAARQTRASLPTPRPAIGRRRRRRAADAPPRPPKARSGAPARRGTDPALVLRSSRTRSRGRDAVAEGVAPRIRAAVRTAGARRRTRAPSRTRRPWREEPAGPLPIPGCSSEALSCRPRLRREAPPCGSRRRGSRRSRHRAGRTPFGAHASSARQQAGDWPLRHDPRSKPAADQDFLTHDEFEQETECWHCCEHWGPLRDSARDASLVVALVGRGGRGWVWPPSPSSCGRWRVSAPARGGRPRSGALAAWSRSGLAC